MAKCRPEHVDLPRFLGAFDSRLQELEARSKASRSSPRVFFEIYYEAPRYRADYDLRLERFVGVPGPDVVGELDAFAAALTSLFPGTTEVAARLHALYLLRGRTARAFAQFVESVPESDVPATIDALCEAASAGSKHEQEVAFRGLATSRIQRQIGAPAEQLILRGLSSSFSEVRLAAFAAARAQVVKLQDTLPALTMAAARRSGRARFIAGLYSFMFGRGTLGQEEYEVWALVRQLPDSDSEGEHAAEVLGWLSEELDGLARAARTCILEWDRELSAQEAQLVLKGVYDLFDSGEFIARLANAKRFMASFKPEVTEALLSLVASGHPHSILALRTIIRLNGEGFSAEYVARLAAGKADSTWDQALAYVYPQLLSREEPELPPRYLHLRQSYVRWQSLQNST